MTLPDANAPRRQGAKSLVGLLELRITTDVSEITQDTKYTKGDHTRRPNTLRALRGEILGRLACGDRHAPVAPAVFTVISHPPGYP